MYQVDVMSRVPVYEQIVDQTEKFVLAGIMKAGDQMPSVRKLSMELSVNPNTIQKAMMELDRRGIICSVPGRGSFIADDAVNHLASARRQELTAMRETLEELVLAGVTKEEIIALVEEVYAATGRKEDQDDRG